MERIRRIPERALMHGGSVRGINAEGCGTFSRKQIDSLVDVAKTYRARVLLGL